MPRSEPLAAEDLLAHAGWMRALAASLVHDSATADDVVQESLLAALRRGPRADRALEPWLSRVVRNVAGRWRRGQARRADRDARAADAPGHDAGDPQATVQRLDAQQLLLEAVRDLPEPSRSTIVLCYFEELSTAEVARRGGVSEATVRWRRMRALGELRAKLDRRTSSREAWCAMLAPWTVSQAATLAGAAGGGGIAGAIGMGVGAKWAAAAVMVGVLGAGWWYVSDTPASVPAAAVDAATLQSPREVAPALQAVDGDANRVGVAEVEDRGALVDSAPAANDAQGASAPRPKVAAAPMRVLARFVDVQGQPWTGVRFSDAPDGGHSGVSGADGRVRLEFDDRGQDERNVQLVASRDGVATRSLRVGLRRGETVDLGELVLGPGARIEGRAQDADGRGLAGVSLGLSPVEFAEPDPNRLRRHGSSRFERGWTAISDERGHFALAGVPAGSWRVWGKGTDGAHAVSAAVEVIEGGLHQGVDVEIPKLLPTDRVAGRVIDPEGAGVPGARIAYYYAVDSESGSVTQTADAQGRFQVVIQLDVACTLVASDPKQLLSDAHLEEVAPGSLDLVLQLRAPQIARVRVVSSDGAPIDDARFEVLVGVANSYQSRSVSAEPLESGVYSFTAPTLDFALTAEADGFMPSDAVELDPATLPQTIEIVLTPAPVLRGRVFADGRALAGAKLEVFAAVGSGVTMTLNDFPCLMRPGELGEATSDSGGNFSVTLSDSSPFYLRCSAAGLAPRHVGPWTAANAPTDVRVELDAGGAIEGRVCDAAGAPQPGAIVGVTNGDGHPRTMRAGHDGRYRFEGLGPGPWWVARREAEFRTDVTSLSTTDEPFEFRASCEVVCGRTTFHDLR